jgi:serine/threonine-protein kinase
MKEIPKTIGRYDILELVGRGGMGVLYRARDQALERNVALKMMLVDFTLDPSARERFQREARAVARLQHRNVVTIHELGEADGVPYIVMEFLSGKDLETLLQNETRLTLAEKLDIAIQLCEGLGYAHEQGIVHRDIKPGNVRVLEDGTVKILDFGIAKFAVSSVTQSGTIMGTPSYMAPEQVMGQSVDGRADLFSAGVLLYELLIGKKPFVGEAPTAVVYQIMHVEPAHVRQALPDLPEALDEIVDRALKKDPDERYSRASEMASDLQMVKMMLDLPLHTEAPTEGTALQTLKLHATTIGAKVGSGATAALNTPMRATAVAAAADAAPRADTESKTAGRGLVWGVAAAVLVAVGLGAGYLLRGGGAAPPPAATTTPSTPAPAPAVPPKDAAASGPATVFIASDPKGAAITINGTPTGKTTPAQIPISRGNPAAVELTLKGYQRLEANLSDADLTAGAKEFRLVRESGPVRLTISAVYPFELVQGGKVISSSARQHELTVAPGGATIRARSAEYLLDVPVAVDYQRSQIDTTLPALGSLTVFSAVETCSVIVDGQDLGFPPIPRKQVTVGSHTVTLKCQDGKGDSQRVTVTTAEPAAVKFGPPKLPELRP